MREVSDRFLSAVEGSNAPRVSANIWLGGELIREDINIVGGNVTFATTGVVEADLSIDFTESDPRNLLPLVDAFGCQVNVLAGFDLEGSVEMVSMGWYEVKESSVDEAWEWFPWTPDAVRTQTVIHLDCEDLMSIVADSDFLSPTQPAAGADAWTTIKDLCAGIVSVSDPGYSGKVIPAGLVYEWSRLDAIKAIAKLWDAYPVMTPVGQLTLATDASGDVLPEFGVQVNIGRWQRASTSRGLKNAVTFLGTDPDGKELVGYALEDAGRLRWDGDFGRRPTRKSSPLMATQSMVDAAAKTTLATMIASRSTTQKLSALWNPAVEMRDSAPLTLPDRTVNGVVTGYVLPLLGGPMSVDLRLPFWS